MAQLAERSAVNRQVPGSIPGEGVFLFGNEFIKIKIKKVLPGLEPGSLDSESRVITITL